MINFYNTLTIRSGYFSLSKKSSESWAFLRKYGIIKKGDKNVEQRTKGKKPE